MNTASTPRVEKNIIKKLTKFQKKNLVRVFLKVFDIYTIQYLTDIFIKSNNFELCAFVNW